MARQDTDMTQAGTEDCAWIQAQLRKLAAAHRELQHLVGAVPANCHVSKRFLSRYFDSNIHYARRSLVLRTLLGDPSVTSDEQTDRFCQNSGPVGFPGHMR